MKLIVVLGPTAAGKSEMALELARRLGGELLCIDSTTVYRELAVGTAKPGPQERAEVPHHLLDLVSIRDPFSFAQFKRAAEDCLEDCRQRGVQPILVGGTHLYLKGILEGYQLSDVPPDPEFRQWAETQSLEALVARLLEVDPPCREIVDLQNPRRVIRALEVCRQGSFSAQYRRQPLPYPVVRVGLSLDKPELQARVERRLEMMIEAGWLEEVEGLLGMAEELRKLRIIGYCELLDVLEGKLTLAQARELITRATLQLARKQMVWYRREQGVNWLRYDDPDRFEAAQSLAAGFLVLQE